MPKKPTYQTDSRLLLLLDNFTGKIRTFYGNHKTLITWATIAVSIAILAATTIYGSIKASNDLINNSDAIVNSYMAGDGFEREGVYVQNQHTNLMKFPLFFIQGSLEYGVRSFYLVNIAFALFTMLGWCLLLAYIFDKRHLPAICLFLSAIIIGSPLFNIDTTYTTVRNLEYVFILFFITALAKYILGHKINKLILSLGLVSYAFVLASDNYFQYVYSLAIITVLGGMLLLKDLSIPRKRMFMSIGLVVSTSIAAIAIKTFCDITGLLVINKAEDFAQSTVGWSAFFPSLWEATRQLANLFGADILGKAIAPENIHLFLNFFLVSAATAGFIWFFKDKTESFSRKVSTLPGLMTLLLATIAIFSLLIYIVGDQVVAENELGQIVSRGQQRYLTGVILIGLIGLVLFLDRMKHIKQPLLVLGVVGIVILSVAAGTYYRQHTFGGSDQGSHVARQSHISVAAVLNEENIDVAITGHWLGATSRFWASDKNPDFRFATVKECNKAFTFVTRADWYRPSKDVRRSAIVVDRSPDNVGDSLFWNNCSDDQILAIYGTPLERRKALGKRGEKTVDIWIYSGDARSRIDRSPLQAVK